SPKADRRGPIVVPGRTRAEAIAGAPALARARVATSDIPQVVAPRPASQRLAGADRPATARPLVRMLVFVQRTVGAAVAPRRLRQALLDELAHDRVHRLCIGEANFGLLRVHVDVDGPARRLDEQTRDRMRAATERVAV